MAVAEALADLRTLSQADRFGRVEPQDAVKLMMQVAAIAAVPIVISAPAAAPPAVMSAAAAEPSPSVAPQIALAPASQPAVEREDVPFETVAEEIERLNTTVTNLTETNDKIMAQNIALLSDLEAAQKMVRELRSEKDTLAVQLKRSLEGR